MSRPSDRELLDLTTGIVRSNTEILDAIVAAASTATNGGKDVGEATGWQQPLAERVVELAAAVHASRASLEYARRIADAGESAGPTTGCAAVYAASVAAKLRAATHFELGALTLPGSVLNPSEPSAATIASLNDGKYAAGIGHVILSDCGGRDLTHYPDATFRMLRDSARELVSRHVTPEIAAAIHAGDLDVPDEIINAVGEAGLFGIAIPTEYNGSGLGNQAMLIATEVLSGASLGGAGSLPTRPEILTNALLRGGTAEQKALWLPQIAAGEVLVAIAMTEPDVGSDVASVKCRAVPGQQGGVDGFFVNGSKAWCTFAGRASIISLLARTEDVAGGDGLSMLIVPKQSFPGHEFTCTQEGGGHIKGKADHTIGYRGMHSFTLGLDQYFVPAANLIGGPAGRGNGLRFQLAGMNGGRLQTSARAIGVAQRALELAVNYSRERKQFGRLIAEYGLTKAHIGQMAAQIQACRALAHHAAETLDRTEKPSKRDGLLPALAKFLACDMANQVTERAQWLHGGWGYATEFEISRLVIDAKVLPLFEGVRAILALKAVAPVLLAA